MSLSLLLADDEAPALERLQHLIGGMRGIEIIGLARDGEEAAHKIRELAPDAVLLDIQMPGRSGLAVAEALEDAGRPQVIFVSAFDHYAARAFEIDATDYLLKPVSGERLSQALERARRRKSAPLAAAVADQPGDWLWAPSKAGQVRVPISAITWVEAAGDYVLLHTALRTHMLRATMAQMAERLAGGGLVRVHRSALVRSSEVIEITRSPGPSLTLLMRDGAAIPVGPSYRASVLAALGLDATG